MFCIWSTCVESSLNNSYVYSVFVRHYYNHDPYIIVSIYVSIFSFFRAVIAFFGSAAIFLWFRVRCSGHVVQAVALRKLPDHKLLLPILRGRERVYKLVFRNYGNYDMA